eukprot:231669-Amphidinium_carterae.1
MWCRWWWFCSSDEHNSVLSNPELYGPPCFSYLARCNWKQTSAPSAPECESITFATTNIGTPKTP